MSRFIKIVLLTAATLIICFGIYMFLTKPKIIEMGENNNSTEYHPDTSYIYMPVSVSLNGLLEGINERLPEVVYDDKANIGSGNVSLLVKRAGKITAVLDSGYLRMNLPFKFKIKYEASENKNALLNFVSAIPLEFDNEIKLAIPISINSDLNLTGLKEGIDLDWEPLPELDIAGLKLNLQSLLEKQLFTEGGFIYEWIIADLLEKISLKEQIAEAWNHFQIEIPVSDKADGFVLTSMPVGITAWYAGGKADSLFAGLKIASMFIVQHKSQVQNKPLLVLPDKISIENKDYFNETSKFSIKVDLTLDALSEITTRYMREADLNYRGFKINLDKASFKNGKNTVYVTIRYSGYLSGEIIIKGTPHVNPETRIFTLKNVGLQNKSSNIFVTSADRVLNEFIVKEIEGLIHFDLGAAVDSLPKMFQSKLTELSVEQGVKTKIQQLKLDKIDTYLTKDKIQLIVNGRTKFFVTPRHYNFNFDQILGK